MRIQRNIAILLVATALLAGCSDDGGGKSGKKSAKAGGSDSGSGMVSVELKVTGDSPASVSIPGINSSLYTGKDDGGDPDLDLDSVKTPWTKKVDVKPGRSLNLQAGSKEPKKQLSCQILINGKVADEETVQNKPGSTLTTSCSATTKP